MITKLSSYILLSLLTLQIAFAQKDELHRALSPYFSPPDSLKGDLGGLRSPLIFNDGTPVETPDQWKKRKMEIKADWDNYLGEWPAFYEKQDFQYLDTVDNGNYIQYEVQFKWTPDEITKGYLLVPKVAKGKMPAVVTVFYDAETAIGIGSRSRPLRPWRDFAVQLANRGFVTLSIGTKEASERNEFSLYYPSIDSVSVQPLSMLGLRREQCLLCIGQ